MKKILPLAIVFILTISNSFAQLTGTYTIGGASPDYNTVVDAKNALNAQGVSGAVVFDIRPGTYNGQIDIYNYAGMSASNRVSFQADTANGGDSTNVIIQNSGYVIYLSGADYVTFKQVNINQLNCCSRTVYTRNGADYNHFVNCVVNGANTTNATSSYATFYNNSSTVDNDGNEIRGCIVNGGSYAFYWWGSNNNALETGTIIENNIISNAYYRGLYASYQEGLIFRNNTLTMSSTYCCGQRGFELRYCVGTNFSNNTITSNHYVGLIQDCNASVSNPNVFYNNMMSGGLAGTYYSLYLYNNTNLNFYYNSLYNNSSSYALYLNGSSSSDIDIRNNILMSNNGYALYQDGGVPNGYNIDYNNYFSNTGNPVYWNGSTVTSLAQWLATGNGANFLAYNPNFVSSTDLHVQAAVVGNAGTPMAAITTDIDGDLRNVSNPDMGADEFDPTDTVNVQLVSIDSPTVPNCTFGNDIHVTIRNIALNTLNTVSIQYLINGTPVDTFDWTGSLASYEKTSVNIGTYSFVDGDDLQINVFAPNGLIDQDITDNTLFLFNFYQPIAAGTHTVYGSSPDFDSLLIVNNRLNFGGICGPVTFNIRDGVYDAEIYLTGITGSSMTNWITFQSESGNNTGVTLAPTNITDYGVIDINATDYITFQNMTVDVNPYGGTANIEFDNGSDYVTINNMRLVGDTNNGDYCIYSDDRDNDYVTITNNVMTDNDYGIYLYGNNGSVGGVIKNNMITGFTSYGVYTEYFTDLTVSNNTIQTSETGYIYGLYVSDFYDGTPVTITNNSIVLDSSDGEGLYIEYIYSTGPKKSLIANNFIFMGGDAQYGVYLYDNGQLDFINNTVNISSTSNWAYPIYIDWRGATRFLNNNVTNMAGGRLMYAGNASNPVIEMDHNNLYSTANTVGYISFYNGSNMVEYATLAAWQTAVGYDLNSLAVDPMYQSTTDFHICNDTLNGAAKVYADVIDDLDGNIRNTSTPDIGADEFSNVATEPFLGQDIALCSGGSVTLDAGAGAASYSWSTGASTQTINVNTAGSYSVTVTGLCGNSGTDDIDVTAGSLTADFTTSTSGASNIILFQDNSTGAPTSYAWDFGDGTTDNGISSNHIFGDAGSYDVTLIATNACGSDTITKTITVAFGTGINELSNESVRVYPNPSNGQFNVNLYPLNKKAQLVVNNYLGQKVFSETLLPLTTRYVFSLEGLSKGIYFLNIYTEDGQSNKKLIIE